MTDKSNLMDTLLETLLKEGKILNFRILYRVSIKISYSVNMMFLLVLI